MARPAPPLPAGAPLQLRLNPKTLRAALAGLGAGAGAWSEPLRWLGLDLDQALHATLRGSTPTAVLRTVEDLDRVLASPPDGGLDGWLETHPLPPAWVHLRIVGRPARAPADAEAKLGERFGGLQRVRLTEPEVAAALETRPEALAALAPLGGATFYRLLSSDLPTVVVVDDHGPWRVVDVIVDLDLGAGAFVAALRALPEVTEAPHAAPLAGAAPAQLRLALQRALTLADTADRVERILPLLSADPRLPPAQAWALLAQRAAERRATRSTGATLFEDLEVTLEAAPGGGVRLSVTSALSAAGASLGGVRGGRAPMDHAAAHDLGPLAVTWAVGAWGQRLRALPAPTEPIAHFAYLLNRCGPTCWTAAWTALPIYFGRAASPSFTALGLQAQPDLPYPALRGASLRLGADLEPRFTALRVEGAAAPPAGWASRSRGAARWLVRGDVADAAPALAPTPQGPVLQVTGPLARGPFERIDARFEYAEGAQRLVIEARPRRPSAPAK